MPIQVARRVQSIRRSFVRELLKATARPDIISFAGGLPNPALIPVEKISRAMQEVLAADGAAALQYTTTEGYPPLREWIAREYEKVGVRVSADQILITTGSQQGLDVLGKVLIDPGSRVIVEDPTYIAALQAFSMYEANFCPVAMDGEGAGPAQLRQLVEGGATLFYCMPNFQNPSGISYSAVRRAEVAAILHDSNTVLVEDDPYGQLRFRGQMLPPIAAQMEAPGILLGTFSKTIAPGMRLGWICAPMELMDRLVIAKQSADLHSENLGQRVIHRLVTSPDFGEHLNKIRASYARQCEAMRGAIQRHLPAEVRSTNPDGGMFLWITLPGEMSAMKLFQTAIDLGVAFVPGTAFHASGKGENTMRLNFSNCDEARIEEGIRRLARAMGSLTS